MKLTAPAYSRATLIMGCGVQEKSEGCYIYDQYGRRFLDLFDAYGNQSFGYGHPRILAALRRQIDSGHTNSCKIFFEEGPTRVGEALAALTNGALSCSFLTQWRRRSHRRCTEARARPYPAAEIRYHRERLSRQDFCCVERRVPA